MRILHKREEDPQVPLIKRASKMRVARLSKGYSQTDMARLTGTTQPTYSRIESGFIQEPDEVILKRISEILKVPTDDLLASETSEESRMKREQTETTLNPKDIPAVLRELKKLLDDGIITETQFTEKRKELLARL
jgi:transcriptional regulator with XRE-family HTH domain